MNQIDNDNTTTITNDDNTTTATITNDDNTITVTNDDNTTTATITKFVFLGKWTQGERTTQQNKELCGQEKGRVPLFYWN